MGLLVEDCLLVLIIFLRSNFTMLLILGLGFGFSITYILSVLVGVNLTRRISNIERIVKNKPVWNDSKSDFFNLMLMFGL